MAAARGSLTPALSRTGGRGRRAALSGLVAVCCLLAAVYSIVDPPFEAPDEPGHYAYVEWLLDGRGIPLQGDEPPPLQPEFSQPPLYYLVEAPFAWIAGRQPANLPDWESQHNPFQNATDFGNANLYLHSSREAFPWTGALLGLHLMRLANLLFVALTVLATYGCAVELGLSAPLAWLAAATAGLVPQLLFLGGALNADNAIGSLSAAALYLLLRWLNRGPSLWTAALLGVALGAAALSKLSGLAAVGIALAFMTVHAVRLRRAKAPGAFGDVGLAAGLAVVVAGWWYVRNWALLGDPLGWSAMLPATGAMLRQVPLDFHSAVVRLLERWYTGLAVFGWANLPVHWFWYWLSAVVGGWGVLGGILVAVRRLAVNGLKLQHWLVLLWPVGFFVALARWVEINTAADQWRLLFPAYPALALIATAGLYRLVRRQSGLLVAIPCLLLVLNVGAIALLVRPAYAPLGPYSGAIEHPTEVRFGEALQLVGYGTPARLHSKPGDTVEVDLFWRALAPIPKDYATDVAAVDALSRLTWKEQSVPDEGRAPMTAWQPGQVVRDRHRIRVRPDMLGAQTLLLSAIDPAPPGDHLPAIGGDGQRLANETVTLGRFLVLPVGLQAPAAEDGVRFKDNLQLSGHIIEQVGGQLRITLHWNASVPPSKDYTVFVHMVSPDGKQVAQHDAQPGGGAFPTSLLSGGVEVPDNHLLDVSALPAGNYRLEIGLYDLASGARLPTDRGDTSVVLPVTIASLPPVPLG